MIAIRFLLEWALRSSILILSGAALLRVFRVKDSSIRLAAWTAMLLGSLAMPALTGALPGMPLSIPKTAERPPQVQQVINETLPKAPPAQDSGIARGSMVTARSFNWAAAALLIYAAIAGALLLRLFVGLLLSRRLLRGSRPAGVALEGAETRESDRVAAPVTLGILRPAIVLPADWPQWSVAKRDAVLAHEASHIRRFDPAVQLLSAIHRALLWYSPLSWFLHSRIVRVAEEASDDAALSINGDRASYAEFLLDFMQRGVRTANWLGVPMARYGRPDDRIHRILDGTKLSRGVTRWSLAAILSIGSPVAYVVAAAHPQSAAQAQVRPAAIPAPSATAIPLRAALQSTGTPKPKSKSAYLAGLGNVVPSNTVTVKPRVDGQLMSVSFQEGQRVQAGQPLATIDPRHYELQLAEAQAQLAIDQAALNNTPPTPESDLNLAQKATLEQLKGTVKIDQARVNDAQLKMSYTNVAAPIAGLTGLRLVDAGNIVHAADAIVIITQLQPIAVLFTIPEDSLPQVVAQLRTRGSVRVEAWDRTNSAKLATGRLTAVDNQIDQDTGTAKLKAEFENKDDALFPGQFVNVRLFLNSQ